MLLKCQSIIYKNNFLKLGSNKSSFYFVNCLYRSSILLNNQMFKDIKQPNYAKLDNAKLNDATENLKKDDSLNKTKDLKSKIDYYFKNPKDPNHDWIQFYKFNHIKTAAMLCKAKIYHTILVTYVFLNSLKKHWVNELPLDQFTTINLIATLSLALLVVVGNLSRRIIGISYYDENYPNLIKIAHLTFFGRRKDIVVNLKDITPLTDTNPTVDKIFLKLVINVEGKDRMFFLANLKFSTKKEEIYKRVFGNL